MNHELGILVTPYKRPDLDGAACAFGYAEFLHKNGKKVTVAISGNLHREAQFVLNKFHIPGFEDAEKIIEKFDEIIIVDASDIQGLSDKIDPEKVIEIIDHRKIHEAHKFPNAKTQIELVGSAATLIAEKFYNSNTEISQESAALLFSAIISNTINFKANVTTKRDHKMANWLKTNFSLPKNYTHEMFSDKSQLNGTLKDIFIEDFVVFHFDNFHLGIAQLELINVDKFIKTNLDEIKSLLSDLKKERALSAIFLTCIDLENAFNAFIAIDAETQKLLAETLEVNFESGAARRSGVIMRKEIVPLLKEALKK